ncbi:HNH endonuclease signature motif containing protein [Corynebacterium sp.]|uniref:HNH endonuclease n=1 Tax=Corynebacterium sp. TaxID=1720 RepID=UPI0025BE6EA1|nr:HNH endonuclease signature motif containing protein [Corynebacterium sp.]
MVKQRMPAAVAREVLERADGACEAMIRGVCTGGAQHLHHRLMRSQGGPHTVANLAAVCSTCHRYVHDNPKFGYESGLLIHSWHPVTWPPAYYRGVYTPREEEE